MQDPPLVVTTLPDAGVGVPPEWIDWSDELRLEWVRDQLRHAERDPALPTIARLNEALRAERHRLVERISYRARMESIPGMARARLFRDQAGLCAICGDELVYDKAHLDHDHGCCDGPPARACGNCYRGLLCGPCNTALGLLKDDPVRIRAAATYLEP